MTEKYVELNMTLKNNKEVNERLEVLFKELSDLREREHMRNSKETITYVSYEGECESISNSKEADLLNVFEIVKPSGSVTTKCTRVLIKEIVPDQKRARGLYTPKPAKQRMRDKLRDTTALETSAIFGFINFIRMLFGDNIISMEMEEYGNNGRI